VLNKSSNAVSDVTGSVAMLDVSACLPDEHTVAAYERDGVVCLRNAHSAAWLAVVEQGIDAALAGAAKTSISSTKQVTVGGFPIRARPGSR